jgi:hypothetical protein
VAEVACWDNLPVTLCPICSHNVLNSEEGTVPGIHLAEPRKVRETSLQLEIQLKFESVLTFDTEDGILLLHKRFVMFYRLCG